MHHRILQYKSIVICMRYFTELLRISKQILEHYREMHDIMWPLDVKVPQGSLHTKYCPYIGMLTLLKCIKL